MYSAAALQRAGKVAVATVTLRQRETLAQLRARDGVLVLQTLLWPDEVREADFPVLDQAAGIPGPELATAVSLIDAMTAPFDPAAHHDRYRAELADLIEAKVSGRRPDEPVLADDPGESADPGGSAVCAGTGSDRRPARPAWSWPGRAAAPPPPDGTTVRDYVRFTAVSGYPLVDYPKVRLANTAFTWREAADGTAHSGVAGTVRQPA